MMAEWLEARVRWFDERQQQRWWLGFPVGVVRKYADDRGSAFAGLVTFQVFLGLLPLLVVVLTVLGRLLEGSRALRDAALESTVGQFPILGERIREDVSTLAATGPVLAVSFVGLLWTATGIYHSLQLALNQVWNVEGVDRQGFVARHVRAVVLFAFLIGAAIATAPVRSWDVPGMGAAAAVVAAVASAATATVILFVVLRLVVSPAVPARCLAAGAVMAGLLWELLQRVGAAIVVDRLARADDLYGALGFVVVTLFWINLLARAVIFANEWSVVAWRRLWPRRIAQPPLTEADERVLVGLMRNERRRPEQRAEITFDTTGDGPVDD